MRTGSFFGLVATASAVTIRVQEDGGKEASPLTYGLMFEDISHSGDGGIYAELIQNRAFQGDEFMPSTLHPWTPYGVATLSLSNDSEPVSPSLPMSVSVRATVMEKNIEVGLANPGYWGIDVLPQTYKGSFYVRGDYSGNFTASLRDAARGTERAGVQIESRSKEGEWTKHEFEIVPEQAWGHENQFTLTFEPESTEQVLNFNLISLFPPTYNDRPNGMRKDLMEAIKDLNPSFLRIPGGNNLQGHWDNSRWRWNETLGDLEDRPGRSGAWNYFNTDGLGLIEYMHWCEDLEVEPILIVWAGLYLEGIVTPEDELDIYIQDALHEIEFLTGDASTEYGAKRAKLGYEEPFELNFVGVGNEDHFSDGLDSYNGYRFRMFFDAIQEAYPDLTIFSSTVELDPIPEGASLDYHDYGNPDGAVRNFTLWDDHDISHKVLVGEYGVARDNGNEELWSNHRPRPWWIASVAEAVFWLGTERNPDKVYGSAFAPLLQHIDHYQWNPNLITFNANTSATTGSTSYHVIKLFSNTRFTTVLPVDNSEEYDPGFWAAGLNEDEGRYIWKGAVYNTTEGNATAATAKAPDEEFHVVFPGVRSGDEAMLTVLTAPDAFSQNYFGEENVVVTEELTVRAGNDGFGFTLPQWSVALLTWDFGKGNGTAR